MIDRDEHLPLHELRTEMPLRDADFAAIRARVRAEIARREERRWSWWPRLAFAMCALVVIVALLAVQPREVAPASSRLVRRLPAGAAIAYQPAPLPALPITSTPELPVIRRPAPKLVEPPAVHAVSRIEIQTSDPTIRIIWLSEPTLPKEES